MSHTPGPNAAESGELWVLPPAEPTCRPSIGQAERNALTAAGWPTHAPVDALAAADTFLEETAAAYDAIIPGIPFGDILRWTWQQIRPQPTCDCPMDPHHRWNCTLTPIWSQTIRDLDCNPWTAVTGRAYAAGGYVTPTGGEGTVGIGGLPGAATGYVARNSSPYTLDSLMVVHCWRCRRMHPLGGCR